jgi:molybdate transport system substrate-binding protein
VILPLRPWPRTIALVVASALCLPGAARADEIRVMTSGAFTAAYLEVTPDFERATGNTLITSYGASMGDTPDSIPSRLQRGEPADVVILASTALDELITRGKVVAGSRVDLVRSRIGVAVRKGAARPDISSVDALKRALLQAKSIAYSSSASGVYISTELFERLGIADQVKAKSRRVDNDPVGAVVARGDAEIGFQQVSELMPVQGIDYLGPLPAEVQKVTVFSAGVAAGSRNPEAARRLIMFLASALVRRAIERSGLEMATSCDATYLEDPVPGIIGQVAGTRPVWLDDGLGFGLFSRTTLPVKTLWVLSRDVAGSFRVEGQRLDGPGTTRFQVGGMDTPITDTLVVENPSARSIRPGGASAEVMKS